MRARGVSADHFEDSVLLFPFYRLQVDITSIKALRDVDPNDYDLLAERGMSGHSRFLTAKTDDRTFVTHPLCGLCSAKTDF